MAIKKNVTTKATTTATTVETTKMRRFCVKCGKEFFTDSKNARYCDDCKAENKKELAVKQKAYAKARNEKLNLTNISVYKDTKNAIKAKAEKRGMTMADFLKEIIDK